MISAQLSRIFSVFRTYKHSIRLVLLLWLLALAIVPFVLVSWYSYEKTVQNAQEMQRNKLEDTALLNVQSLRERFYETNRDLDAWSKLPRAVMMMDAFSQGWTRSGQRLETFVRSPHYDAIETQQAPALKIMAKHYDYVYDLFLIDLEGNILYTVAKEPDFGTNLVTGAWSSTRFARAYRATVRDRKAHFSDIEKYAPSNGVLAGFITRPIVDPSGTMIGVIAMQLNMESLFGTLQGDHDREKITHYLVGADGLLRTALNHPDDVLKRRISSENFWNWYHEHGLFATEADGMEEPAEMYIGPNGKRVLGQHHSITLLGVQWAHISEINEEDFMEAPYRVGKTIVFFTLLMVLLVIVAAIVISRRITQPIQELSKASYRYMHGEKGVRVPNLVHNEIGEFGTLFNTLIETQEQNKDRLAALAEEAKESLEALKEQKYALDAHAIVAITDVKGTITFINEKFEQISGYSSAELVGKNHRILNSGTHSESFWKEMYHTVSHGGVWHAEVCNRAKDGHMYWVDTTIVPFMGSDNKPQSYIAIRTDISERKNAEIVIAEKEGSLQTLLDSVAEGIYGVDVNGYCTFANKSFLRILGFDHEDEVLGKHIHELIHHSHADGSVYPSHECKMYKANITHQPTHVDDEVFWKKDGSYIAVEYWSYPMLREGVYVGAVATFLDISERKEAERQIVEAKNIAERSAQAKSEFLAAMSHEIRTPMNGVLGMLNLLSHSKMDETQRHQIRIASKSANSLLGLINDILDFSKVEAGKMELEMIPFDLQNELQELTEAISFRAQEKGLDLTLDTTQLHHISVITDAGRLRQILTNLVGNAVKFTHSGGIRITARVDEIDETHGKLCIDVQDSGVGIPADKIDSLFDLFTQADTSTTRKYGGTGLGLAIVKKLCELMGGSISVASQVDKGSTFSVEIAVELGGAVTPSLPQSSGGDKTMDVPEPQESQAYVKNGEGLWPADTRVLLVEDNITNQMVAQGMLEIMGLKADIANNGLEAIALLQNAPDTAPYTIVLMDCQMPEMDGYMASTAIRAGEAGEINKNIPIVAMTANAMIGDREKCFTAGMSDYVSKPINLATLESTLCKWLKGETSLQTHREKKPIDSPSAEKDESEFKVWDEADALERLGGKREFVTKIMQSFIADSDRAARALREAIEEEDWANAQLHAHSIKGSAGNLSAKKLQALAKTMEFAAKSGDKKILNEGYVNLKKAMDEVVSLFETYLAVEAAPVKRKKKVDPLALAIQLQTLKKEIQNGASIDVDGVGIFMEYKDEALTKEMNRLKEAIERFDNSEAISILDTIMGGLE